MGQIQDSDGDLRTRVAEEPRSTAIRVETDGTKITLTGTVRSWAESNRACHAAWSMPGVTNVDNRLTVV